MLSGDGMDLSVKGMLKIEPVRWVGRRKAKRMILYVVKEKIQAVGERKEVAQSCEEWKRMV